MTEVDVTTLSATVAGLVVAGLSVYAYTQLGAGEDTRAEHDTQDNKGEGLKGKKKRKGKAGVGDEAASADKGKAKGKGKDQDGAPVVPGGFEGAPKAASASASQPKPKKKKKQGKQAGEEAEPQPGSTRAENQPAADEEGAKADAGDDALVGISAPGSGGDREKRQQARDDGAAKADAAPAPPPAVSQSTSAKGRKKKSKQARDEGEVKEGDASARDAPPVTPQPTSTKTKKKNKPSKQAGDEDEETGVEAGRAAAGDGTDADASASLSPSASGSIRAQGVAGVPSQLPNQVAPRPQALRSLSFDTDGSWTHVDRRRPNKTGGQIPLAEMEVTSSDLASTESSSPVAERVESVANDIRGTRGDLEKRTFAEKFVPRPVTSVDDMLEQPNFHTLARVMRVQPRADETPVPGFSWEDYGDVVEESVLVHDADEEDEGEWGIVKSRNRTRPTQTPAIATTTSQTTTAPETMTKKQRQNARKRELAKAVKADAEAARLQGLAKHKRELERLQIIEQSQQGGGKQPSGGMHATVDDRGKLVWE